MTTNTDTPCPCADLAHDGDDDRVLRLLREYAIPALTPKKFVVTIEVATAAPYHTVKTLVDQYRSILDIPLTEQSQDEIASELRDIASTVENLPTLICQDLNRIFEADECFCPDTFEARMLGIEIDRGVTVTDG